MNVRNRIDNYVVEMLHLNENKYLVSLSDDNIDEPVNHCIDCFEICGEKIALKSFGDLCEKARIMRDNPGCCYSFMPRWYVSWFEDETGNCQEVFDTYAEAWLYYNGIPAHENPGLWRC